MRGAAPVRSTIVEAACCCGRSGVEIDVDKIAELAARLVGVHRGGLAGDVGAGHRHRSHLAQQLDGDRVQRHSQHHGAAGIAEIPLQRRRLDHHQAQRPRPECADQVARPVGHACRPGPRWCARNRPARPPACRGHVPWPRASAATAVLSNASAPMPYTVSVGITTSRPPLSAPTAEAIPRERWSGSAQSNTSAHRLPLSAGRHKPWPPGQILSRPGRRRKALCPRPIRQSAPTWCRRARRRTSPPGRSQRPARRTTAAYHRHAVRSAEDRVRWIMLRHFGIQHGTVGNIGRVCDDEVYPRRRVPRSRPGVRDVGSNQFDLGALGVATCVVEGRLGVVDADDSGGRPGAGPAPPPTRRIRCTGRRCSGRARKGLRGGPFQDGFGLRTRYEHTRTDVQHHRTESPPSPGDAATAPAANAQRRRRGNARRILRRATRARPADHDRCPPRCAANCSAS